MNVTEATGLHPFVDEKELNATFGVTGSEDAWVITFESRGGTSSNSEGSAERNRDYNDGIEVVLSRLAAIDAVMTGAFLASRSFEGLPDEARVLAISRPFPVSLAKCDLRRLRIDLCAAQTDTRFRREGAGGGGNRTKRFEIRVLLPEPVATAASFVTCLVGGFGESPARDVFDFPVDPIAAQHRGAGYMVDQKLKLLIEDAAMKAAVEHYEPDWQLTDVSGRRGLGYDLLAERGDEQRYIEVKGTTSLGLSVGVTFREVETAETERNTDLFIYWGVRFDDEGQPTGTARIISPWIPSEGTLKPRAFDFFLA